MANNNLGVTGTDGIQPYYLPAERWTIWNLADVYKGGAGSGKFIPKINDYVIDVTTNTVYKTVSYNTPAYTSNLLQIALTSTTFGDILMSGTASGYRVYYDKSVTPNTLTVDGFMHIYSSVATKARIYAKDINNNDIVVSKVYDSSGNLTGNDIDLVKVAYNSHDNYAVKSIRACNTDTNLTTGDSVTIVVYDSVGNVVTKTNAIIEETTYIPQAYSNQKYIVNMYLQTPYLNPADDRVILYPLNQNLSTFKPNLVLVYNDGTISSNPIDGGKYNLAGLNSIPPLNSSNSNLTLIYTLDPNESAIATIQNGGGYITKPYSLTTVDPDPLYGSKLYFYPVWNTSSNKYDHKVYFTILDRSVCIDITNKVSFVSGFSFDGTASKYNQMQTVKVRVDAKDISNVYKTFIIEEEFTVKTMGSPTNPSSLRLWTVKLPSTASNEYGDATPASGLKAVRLINTRVNISNNISTLAAWLDATYKKTNAIYNTSTEGQAPDPTHMEISYQGNTILRPLSSYNSNIDFPVTVNLYSNIQITFLKQTLTGYLKLSVIDMIVR